MYLTKKTYVGNEYRKPEEMIKVVMPKNQDGVSFPTKIPIKNFTKPVLESKIASPQKINKA